MSDIDNGKTTSPPSTHRAAACSRSRRSRLPPRAPTAPRRSSAPGSTITRGRRPARRSRWCSGLTMDASGQYAASGMDERLGAMMAIKEINAKGGVLGRPIEAIHMDSETTPATGSRVAERLITRNEAAFLIGALHSGVANAISQVAQKYGCIFLNTNSSSPTEAGKDCHRVKFVWDGNGTNFALAIVKNAMAVNGKNWVLLTNDYVWGHNTSKATRTIVEANGGKIVEELLVPQNTRDFSSYLLKIQQIKPNVVAAADRRRRHQGAASAGRAGQAEQESGVDQQPAGLAGRLWPRARGDLRRVRHELVLPARSAGRQGIRRRVPDHLSRRADPRARQHVLQRLHGHARAAARRGARRHDEQHQGHQGARGAQGLRPRPDAGLRRVHESGDASAAADDLHGDLQRRAGGEGRHLQDPGQAAAEGRRGSRKRRSTASSNPTRRRRATRCRRGTARRREAHGNPRPRSPRIAGRIRFRRKRLWNSSPTSCRTSSTAFRSGSCSR